MESRFISSYIEGILLTKHVLVTYATRTGSTIGVAQAIGAVLTEHGAQVDVLPMPDVQDIFKYQAVVAGSAIQANKWLPEAINFVETHQSSLKQRPFAAFLVCMTLAIANGKYRDQTASYLEPVRMLVKPVSQGLFAGSLDISKVPSLSDRVKFKLSVVLGVWKEGDHRDWNAIRAWADTLSTELF
jgi:menaquinone-dependent protoporphyrinogen oxidase